LVAYSNQKNKVITQKEEGNQTYKIEVKKRQEFGLIYKIKIDSAEAQIVKAGDWMNEHFPFKDHPEVKEEKIMAAMPLIGYYINRTFVEFAPSEAQFLVADLKQKGIKYLYFGKHEASRYLNLAFLLNPDMAPQGLTPILDLSANSQYPAILYEVK
jgi:hypothetical protein